MRITPTALALLFVAAHPHAAFPAPPQLTPPDGNHIALLYSSNVRGEYEPCG